MQRNTGDGGRIDIRAEEGYNAVYLDVLTDVGSTGIGGRALRRVAEVDLTIEDAFVLGAALTAAALLAVQ